MASALACQPRDRLQLYAEQEVVMSQARRAKPASPQTGFTNLYAVLSFSPRRLDPNPSPNPNLKCCFVSLKRRITFDECQLEFLPPLGSQAGVWFVARLLRRSRPCLLECSVLVSQHRASWLFRFIIIFCGCICASETCCW